MARTSATEEEIANAVFSAPWKTPSQYAAMVNTIQRALDVTQFRQQKHRDKVRMMTDKCVTDVVTNAKKEDARRVILSAQDEKRRHIARSVDQLRGPLPPRAATPNQSLSSGQTKQRGNSGLPPRPISTPLIVVSPSRPTKSHQPCLPPSYSTNGTSASHEERKKLSAKDGHYIFEDEVGLIDIDEGDSDGGSNSGHGDESSRDEFNINDEEGTEPQLQATRAAYSIDDEGNYMHQQQDVSPSIGIGSDDEGDIDDDEAGIAVPDHEVMAFIAQLEDETADMVHDIAAQSVRYFPTDSTVHNTMSDDVEWVSTTQLTVPPNHSTTSSKIKRNISSACSNNTTYSIQQSRSIALYMSAIRPNGARAVVEIETKRRDVVERSWLEQWEKIFFDYTRQNTKRRIQDTSTNRNAQVIIEQEAGARISFISRCQASLERLKREERLQAKKVERMAKFRGRLNAKEDAFKKDDAKQRDVLDQLAHKMLERVMRQDHNDHDVLVDNTDQWEAGRRRSSVADKGKRRLSTAIKASTVLTTFYNTRRRTLRSPSQSGTAQVPSAPHTPNEKAIHATAMVSFDVPDDNNRRGTHFNNNAVPVGGGAHEKRHRGSMWSPNPQPTRSRSISYGAFSSNDTPQPDDPLAASTTSNRTEPTRELPFERKKLLEERWERDAQKITKALQDELLHKCRPDFGQTYDERLKSTPQDVDQSITPMESPPMFAGFTFGNSSGADDPLPPKDTPQKSAILAAKDFQLASADEAGAAAREAQENPVAAALKKRQDDAKSRHEERIAEYRRVMNRQNLAQAVDHIIHGGVRHVKHFQELAGLRQHDPVSAQAAASSTIGRLNRNRAGSREPEFLIDRQPLHSKFDVSSQVAQIVAPSPAAASPLFAPLKLDAGRQKANVHTSHEGNDEHSTAAGKQRELVLLRRTSLARMRSADRGESRGLSTNAARASFATFALDDDPTLSTSRKSSELPGLVRRSSSFFRPTSAADGGHSELNPQGTPWQTDKQLENSLTDRTTLETSNRQHRSNVASLVLTSGLGRYDVAETRKNERGDTMLYAKQRSASRSASLMGSPVGDRPASSGIEAVLERSVVDTPRASSESSDVVEDTMNKLEFSTPTTAAMGRSKAVQFIPNIVDKPSSPAFELLQAELHPPVSTPITAASFADDDIFHLGPSSATSLAPGGDKNNKSLRRASAVLGGTLHVSRHPTPNVSALTADMWALQPSDF